MSKINKKNSVKVVFQNTFIKAKITHNMDVNAQKLFRLAISQSKMTDKEFFQYEVPAIELSELFDINAKQVYKFADKWTSQCMGCFLEFRESDNQKFKKYSLFSTCEYENGILKMKLNPDMTPFFLNVQKKLGFTQYELSTILVMKGKYSIRIYEMIVAELKNRKIYADKCVKICFSVDEFRKQTNTESTFKQIGQLKDKVLNISIREIQKATNWHIDVKDIKQGRKIIGFEFEIMSQVGFEYMNMIAAVDKKRDFKQK